MIIVDASAIIEVLLRTPSGLAVEDRLLESGKTLHAPHLIDVEVAQVMRRYVGRRELSPERAWKSLDLLRQFPIERYAHEPLLSRIWQLREHFTAYDAAYVALAEALHATLITRDTRMAGAPGHQAQIEVV